MYLCLMYIALSHLTGLFYFTLGNVSPEYRSQLSCVYLVAIVKKKLIDKYSMPSIISPFVEDVAKLVCVVHV